MDTHTETSSTAALNPGLYLGDDQSMWVLNKWKMALSFSIEGRNNDIVISLPRTWVPLDLTQYAQKEQISNSPNFRTMLGQGKVQIISTADAHEILSREGALEEQQRILSGSRIEIPNRTPVQSQEPSDDTVSAEEIVMANLVGASEADAINRAKLMEMQNAMTPSLKRQILTYSEERGYRQLRSIVEKMMVVNPTGPA